eukprot:4534362-Amphidinium_carterae.1
MKLHVKQKKTAFLVAVSLSIPVFAENFDIPAIGNGRPDAAVSTSDAPGEAVFCAPGQSSFS